MVSPGPNTFPSSRGGVDSKASRPRKKGATGGMFSTLAGISRIEDEDDEFKMMDARGKNNVEVELGRVSEDSEQRRGMAGGQEGITVQKNWSVFVDERGK